MDIISFNGKVSSDRQPRCNLTLLDLSFYLVYRMLYDLSTKKWWFLLYKYLAWQPGMSPAFAPESVESLGH